MAKKTTVMKTIAFRAECGIDVHRLLKLLPEESIDISSLKIKKMGIFPDVLVYFSSPLTIHEIKYWMAIISDSHVMIETCAHNQPKER